jgi:hypothetical protein
MIGLISAQELFKESQVGIGDPKTDKLNPASSPVGRGQLLDETTNETSNMSNFRSGEFSNWEVHNIFIRL